MGFLNSFLIVFLSFGSNVQNSKSVQDPFAIDKWNVAQAELSGKPIFIRANIGFRGFKDKAKYPYRIGFAFPLLKPNENGLPTHDEGNQLSAVEDTLLNALTKKRLAFLTLVITTQGMREFVFYSNQSEAVQKQIDILKESIKSHEFQSYIESDKNWEVFIEYAK